MTICPVASITRVNEGSTGRVPGAANAAIVSPAIPTSQLITPLGITTFPPRMIRSSMLSLPCGNLAFAAQSSIALGYLRTLLHDRGRAYAPTSSYSGNEWGNAVGARWRVLGGRAGRFQGSARDVLRR